MTTKQRSKTKELLLAATMFGAVAGTSALARTFVTFSPKTPISESVMRVKQKANLSPLAQLRLEKIKTEANRAYVANVDSRRDAANSLQDFALTLAAAGVLVSLLIHRFVGYGEEIKKIEQVAGLAIPVSYGKVPCPDQMRNPIAKLYGWSIPLITAVGPILYFGDPTVKMAVVSAGFMGVYFFFSAYSFTSYYRVKVGGFKTESEFENEDRADKIKNIGRNLREKRRWND